jgi:hypothetical protein
MGAPMTGDVRLTHAITSNDYRLSSKRSGEFPHRRRFDAVRRQAIEPRGRGQGIRKFAAIE